MDDLLAQAVEADYLVLGEIHDNPLHHRLQAELLARYADRHPSTAVGFEQLDVDQEAALIQYRGQSTPTAEGLAEAVDWPSSGWPDFAIYAPLFEEALRRELSIQPLMSSRSASRRVLENGFASILPDPALQVLQPDRLLDAREREEVGGLMQDAHCGMLPEDRIAGMVNVQIARDAFMAWRAFQAGERAVIITGNGHARRDRGLPRFLQRLTPPANIVVIQLLEWDGGDEGDARAFVPADSVADFVILTPGQEREDPCLAFQ
jgi:uncharacterized iron-regulated protein